MQELIGLVSGIWGPVPREWLRTEARPVSWLEALLSEPAIKALLPIPILAALVPIIVWFFRGWWQGIEAEVEAERAAVPRTGTVPRLGRGRYRGRAGCGVRVGAGRRRSRAPRVLRLPRGKTPAGATRRPVDYRPLACMVITAVVLTMQEYYGGREFFHRAVRPWLHKLETGWQIWLGLTQYEELWGYGWWSACRVAGYVLLPFPLWKLLFPGDRLKDMGLRLAGLGRHLWIYGLCLLVVVPATWLVSTQPDFGTYYPFYKLSSRSLWDWILWEALYFLQFLALEMFFRGWMLGALRRSMGGAAIFAMVVPYCMIHYGKPYLEAHAAIVAGTVLGTLAMRTRSIYLGFVLHVTVAFLMDFFALYHRGALPTVFWPPG